MFSHFVILKINFRCLALYFARTLMSEKHSNILKNKLYLSEQINNMFELHYVKLGLWACADNKGLDQ